MIDIYQTGAQGPQLKTIINKKRASGMNDLAEFASPDHAPESGNRRCQTSSRDTSLATPPTAKGWLSRVNTWRQSWRSHADRSVVGTLPATDPSSHEVQALFTAQPTSLSSQAGNPVKSSIGDQIHRLGKPVSKLLKDTRTHVVNPVFNPVNKVIKRPLTHDENLAKLPKWTEEEIDEIIKRRTIEGHTGLHNISLVSRAGNEVNEDRAVYKVLENLGIEIAGIFDGHGGNKKKGERGACSQHLALTLIDRLADNLSRAIQSDARFRYDNEAVQAVVRKTIEDHDEEFCRTVNLNGGATSTGTIYDRTAKKMHTWGVGDCTNIALFKDLETGEVTGESMITLHTAKNKEHLEKLEADHPNAIHRGRWGNTVEPTLFHGNKRFKFGGSEAARYGAATLKHMSVDSYDMDTTKKKYIASILASDGMDFGDKYWWSDTPNTLQVVKRATEIYTSLLGSALSAVPYLRDGLDWASWSAKASDATRWHRDDQTVMVLQRLDSSVETLGNSVELGLNTADWFMAPV